MNKTIVITGASGGIGTILVEGFLKNEDEVIMLSRNEENLKKTKENFEKKISGSKLSYIVTDVSDYNSVKEAFSKISSLDVLVNCAGILGPVKSLEEADMKGWLETLMVNLMGTVYCCKEAVSILKKNTHRGKIINISGGGSAYPRKMHSAYGVSKTGVVRLTDTLAQEFRDSIDVNVVAPGAHKTKMWEEETFDKEPEKWGDPKRLVDLVLFLSSEKSDNITGKFIHIYDEWEKFDPSISDSDMFTLRRVERCR